MCSFWDEFFNNIKKIKDEPSYQALEVSFAPAGSCHTFILNQIGNVVIEDLITRINNFVWDWGRTLVSPALIVVSKAYEFLFSKGDDDDPLATNEFIEINKRDALERYKQSNFIEQIVNRMAYLHLKVEEAIQRLDDQSKIHRKALQNYDNLEHTFSNWKSISMINNGKQETNPSAVDLELLLLVQFKKALHKRDDIADSLFSDILKGMNTIFYESMNKVNKMLLVSFLKFS